LFAEVISMTDATKAALEAALEEIAGALASLCLERAFSVSELVRVAKRQYVRQAQRIPMPPGIDPSARNYSLLAARTGLTRKEVKRIVEHELDAQLQDSPKIRETLQRGERVIAGWRNDLRFQEGGKPRILAIAGEGPTFAELCRLYSGEARHATILKDLLRVGAVELLPNHRVRLERATYAAVGWTEEGFAAMGTQVKELIETHLHNFRHPEDDEQQACLRVGNPRVLKRWAASLVRDATAQLKVVSKLADGSLNNPEVTGAPDDPLGAPKNEALETVSVTCFIRRAPSVKQAPITPTIVGEAPPKRARVRRSQTRTR
jgi:hypothetical protein